MASVAILVGGALVNALAFSGSNFLFSKLGASASDVDKERHRHDKAIESLQTAQSLWSRRRIDRLDWINEELRRQNHAAKTFSDVDSAMREYSQIYNTASTLEPLGPSPKLSDFYRPSSAQKDREMAFVVLGTAASSVVAYNFIV